MYIYIRPEKNTSVPRKAVHICELQRLRKWKVLLQYTSLAVFVVSESPSSVQFELKSCIVCVVIALFDCTISGNRIEQRIKICPAYILF